MAAILAQQHSVAHKLLLSSSLANIHRANPLHPPAFIGLDAADNNRLDAHCLHHSCRQAKHRADYKNFRRSSLLRFVLTANLLLEGFQPRLCWVPDGYGSTLG
jgi:hypothetical protein